MYQGTAIGRANRSVEQMTIDHIRNTQLDEAETRLRFDLTQQLNKAQMTRRAERDDQLEAVISSYELAWRMQAHAPEILDIARESNQTHQMYGIGEKATDSF